jgi:hypothetical protein
MIATPNIGSLHKQITAVGSRVTCDPAPMHTDQDWLVYVAESDYDRFAADLIKTGWVVGGSLIPADVNTLPGQDRFNSFTSGEHNIIATCSVDFHQRFLSASSAAKKLNLLDKAERITLFQSVLYATIHSPDFQPALTTLFRFRKHRWQ